MMNYVVAFMFGFLIFLPCALLLGGLLDLAWDKFVLRVNRRQQRGSRSSWFNTP